jgi:hypothetical protein
VGGVILGPEAELLRVLKEAGGDQRGQKSVRHGEGAARPRLEAMADAVEAVLGLEWGDGSCRTETGGREGLLAV